MSNYFSAFTLYEIFRMIIPGIYVFVISHDINTQYHIIEFPSDLSNTYKISLFIILSILIGGLVYSFDLCRVVKRWIKNLPTNLIETNLKHVFSESGRELEDLYYNYYNNLPENQKYKTEIQSGLYHLFFSMAFVSLFMTIIYLILFNFNVLFSIIIALLKFYNNHGKDFLHLTYPISTSIFYLNLFVFFISIISIITIYMFRLRYSWKRNYDVFVEKLINGELENKYYSESSIRKNKVARILLTKVSERGNR